MDWAPARSGRPCQFRQYVVKLFEDPTDFRSVGEQIRSGDADWRTGLHKPGAVKFGLGVCVARTQKPAHGNIAPGSQTGTGGAMAVIDALADFVFVREF